MFRTNYLRDFITQGIIAILIRYLHALLFDVMSSIHLRLLKKSINQSPSPVRFQYKKTLLMKLPELASWNIISS